VTGEEGNYAVDVEKLIWWPDFASDSTFLNHDNMLIFVVGPTASGKSGLAMELAEKLNGEIICADSQTLRKSLDIGTAKPSKLDQQKIKHHLLDVIEPYERYSVAQFKKLAKEAISDIQGRGKLPIIVGGTGLYINALYFDFDVNEDSSNSKYKTELEQKSVKELQEIIRESEFVMPENMNNPRHLIGVILREGQVRKDIVPVQNALIYGLMPEDEVLKNRISERVMQMFDNGLIEEVRGLILQYGEPPEKLDAIGYPITARLINGEINEMEARNLFVQAHWQYARRQKSWFKRNKNIKWFQEVKQASEHICSEIELS
jgi:tRNA dimethylallyltransferase